MMKIFDGLRNGSAGFESEFRFYITFVNILEMCMSN